MRLMRLCGDAMRLVRLCGDAMRLVRLCGDAARLTRLSAEHWKEVKAARSLQESRSARGGVKLQECRLFGVSLSLQ
jgi:hypothetical protein